MPFRSSAPEKTDIRRRSVIARLAGLGAAGVLATFVAAPGAFADSATPTDTTSDAPPASDPGTSAPSDSTTDPAPSPSTSDPGTSSSAPSGSDSSAPSSGPTSSAPHTGTPGTGGTHTKPKTGVAKPNVVQAITPNYGTQKIRVSIQLDSHNTFAPGTSLANSQIEADETGPNAPTGPAATCDTDSSGNCAFGGPGGYYVAAPGDTVTFTELSPPDGPGVLTDSPQVVGPCQIPQPVITAASVVAVDDVPDCGLTSIVSNAANASKPQPNVVDRGIFDTAAIFIDPAAPPQAIDDSATVHTGHSVDVSVLANDVVYGLPATLVSVTQPAHGTVVKIGSHVSYTPDAGYGGPDTFTYTMSTANGTDSATVHITVLAPPIARDDTATTTAGDPGASVVIPVLANDSANGGSPVVLSFAANAAHGTIEIAGTDEVRYTPQDNFVGVDTFRYTITTPNGSSTATVTVTITAPVGVGALANTGVQPEQLATIAGLLVLAGGWATFSGRRNRVRRAH